jgi:AAA family ATPase
VIGNEEVKLKLDQVLSFASGDVRETYQRFGISGSVGGVLLYGPPGNSKTRLVMAAASSRKLPLISLTVADVYSAYVGDAEAEIRRAFRLARQARPCVIFLDEIDALVTDRASGSGSGSGSSSSVEGRVLASLLTEMDGIDGNGDGVFVIAATNRVDQIDAALLRKGRFHHVLAVSPPSLSEMKTDMVTYFGDRYQLPEQTREEIRRKIVEGTQMSGADVENLCREAGMKRIREVISASDAQTDTAPDSSLEIHFAGLSVSP